MKRRSVRWLVRLGLLILVATLVTGLVAYTLRGRDPEGLAGQWQRTGVPDTILMVERDGGDYRVRFEDRGSGVSQTVPATLSGNSLVTSTPLDTAVASALEIPGGVLVSLAKADGSLQVGADPDRARRSTCGYATGTSRTARRPLSAGPWPSRPRAASGC
jgi:hypothetical protein